MEKKRELVLRVGDLVLRVGGKEETLVLPVVVVWLLLFCFV